MFDSNLTNFTVGDDSHIYILFKKFSLKRFNPI